VEVLFGARVSGVKERRLYRWEPGVKLKYNVNLIHSTIKII